MGAPMITAFRRVGSDHRRACREPLMTDLHPPVALAEQAADPYRWLQQRDHPAVLEYLHAENAYLEQQLAGQASLREALFQEIKGRIRETDLSLPTPWGPWLYYSRTTAGDEYPRHYRCPRP